MGPDRIDAAVRAGHWAIVHCGVYAERELAAACVTHRDRRLLADRAASLRVGCPHAMSHESSAYELDLAILHPPRPITHLTRPGVVGSHLRHGVKHHLAPYVDDQVLVVDGRRGAWTPLAPPSTSRASTGTRPAW